MPKILEIPSLLLLMVQHRGFHLFLAIEKSHIWLQFAWGDSHPQPSPQLVSGSWKWYKLWIFFLPPSAHRTVVSCAKSLPLLAKVDFLIAGFPCVSISPLTTTPGSVVDAGCSSGSGFLAVEAYVKRHRPSLLCLENVSTLFNHRKVEGGESGFPGCNWPICQAQNRDHQILGKHSRLATLSVNSFLQK